MNRVSFIYIVIALLFCIFSFGFIDPNLHLSSHPTLLSFTQHLMFFVYKQSYLAAVLYIGIVVALFVLYWNLLKAVSQKQRVRVGVGFIIAGLLYFLAYPALSYDIYNYILTAKVAFYYQENPYVVMPIEFIGEPMLAFTRAANKLALYGPVWITATFVPYVLAKNNILLSIYAFKTLSILGYLGLTYLIYKKTKSHLQTAFFALNPLVILETFVSGHNDTFMMLLALGGLLLWHGNKISKRIAGLGLIFASVLVKGATIVILPVIAMMRKLSFDTQIKWVAIFLFGVFMLSPFREEMYPWYATWWIVCLAFIPIKPRSFVHGAAYWMSFGLMMRYVPWIATREYGGTGPMIRLLFTWVPTAIYAIYFWIHSQVKKR